MGQQYSRVAMYGLGEIGIKIARLVQQQPHLELVGAIEHDPAKVGRDLGDVLGLDQPLNAPVLADAPTLLRRTQPHVVVIATTSLVHEVFPQICDCLEAGVHVVSTCEQLIYPYALHPEVSRHLDQAARKEHVAILGIGINPGFVMDMLPILMTAPCTDIRHVLVERSVDAGTRRATLQQRIGAGLDPLAFRSWLQQRNTPHVGLLESLQMIADALGWPISRTAETAEPLIAETWLRTPYVTVAPGQVSGIHQSARGYVGTREVLQLEWRTAIGMVDTHDAIKIDGTPPVDLVIRGGLHGDQATAALVTRAVSAVRQLAPGLRTVLDLPVLHYQPPHSIALAR